MFEERRRGGFFKTFLIALITSLGVGALMFYAGMTLAPRYFATPQEPRVEQDLGNMPTPQQLTAEVSTARSTAAAVAKSASPGVVGVSVLKLDTDSILERNAVENWNVGSGVIVTPDGYILTNHHVAGGKSKRIVISLIDGRNIDGTTIWSDPVLDLAIVKVNEENLPTIALGDSDDVEVGETAIAIGNPLGLQFQRTVTSGIVSAVNRTIEVDNNYMEDLIQTDASINPGNSGGPLLNSRGEVIGINTIKVTSAEAIGFAVPINVVKPILEQLTRDGEFREAYMGIFAYDREMITYIDNNYKLESGIYVVKVDKNGPAYKNGIKEGCIITEVDGKKMDTMMDLRCHIYSKKPGDIINVTHVSGGKTETVQIRLAAKNQDGLITR